MSRMQSHSDIPARARRAGEIGLRWGVAGASTLVLSLSLLCWSGFAKERLAQSQAAISSFAAHLYSAPDRVASNPSGLLSDIQQTRSELSRLGLVIPQGAASALDRVVSGATDLAADTDRLNSLMESQSQFSQALSDVSSTTRLIQSRPSLTSDRWGQALASSLTELTRPELASMPAVFAPSEESADIQKQWAQRFASVATTLNRLPSLAARDNTLSAEDKEALSAWVGAAQSLSTSSQALVSGALLRARAHRTMQDLRPVVNSGAPSLASLSPSPINEILSWVGLALGIISLVCWVAVLRAILLTRNLAFDVSEESRSSHRQVDAIDRLMRQIQKVAPADGPVHLGVLIEEEPSSPLFPVATGFNRLIETLNLRQRLVTSHASDLDYSLAPLVDGINEISTLHQRAKLSGEGLEVSGLAGARVAASTAEKVQALAGEVKLIQEGIWSATAMLQERGFRMDALRENNQDIAKRIKRLGESSQNIGLASERIYTVGQQLRVLSINIAIEAAAAGEAGQPFTSMAQEVQRLALAGLDAAHEIDGVVDLLLTDASEVASTMEAGTGEVVESGRLSEQTEASVREIERATQPLATDLARLSDELEAHALSLNETAERQSVGKSEAAQAHGLALRLQEGVSALRQKVRGFGRDTE